MRRLEVEIMDIGSRVPELLLVEPLDYAQADSIEVFLPWPIGLGTTGTFEGAAFTVTRPPEGVNLITHLSIDRASQTVPIGRTFWKRLVGNKYCSTDRG